MRISKRVYILCLALFLTACHPRPSIVARIAVAPAPIALFDLAIQKFARSDYSSAARDFEQYLKMDATGSKRDQALFHLGLVYVLPGDTRQDWQRAVNYLSRLVTEFPASPLKPVAQLILSLRTETVQLESETKKRDERIRQLNAELERFIKIDSGRRPRP